MASADSHEFDEQLLTRYLLGELAEEEAQRLDERSIADATWALRLDAVENDLVDAYVEGELSGQILARFEGFYLSSPERRERVEFARALRLYEEKTASTRSAAKQQNQASQRFSARRWFTVPRLGLQWGLAAAALAMLFVSSYLALKNTQLRKEEIEAQSQQLATDRHAQELERELSKERSENTGILRELEGLRASLPQSHLLKSISVLLLAATRGAGQPTSVSIPQGTERVRLQLQLEANEYAIFQVALKDPSTNRILWDASKLRSSSQGQNLVVSASVPAHLLKQQNYLLELTGSPAQGNAELVTSYVFRVVLE